jgi:hypothetical protein
MVWLLVENVGKTNWDGAKINANIIIVTSKYGNEIYVAPSTLELGFRVLAWRILIVDGWSEQFNLQLYLAVVIY